MKLDLIEFYGNYINNVKAFIAAFPAFEKEGLRLIEQAKELIKEEFRRRSELANKAD